VSVLSAGFCMYMLLICSPLLSTASSVYVSVILIMRQQQKTVVVTSNPSSVSAETKDVVILEPETKKASPAV
uniref:Uncharacterized protein n=1 Tax=Caenorhabditis japonica TaxID=281687 RepID=A0A8R1IQA6_CAEJA